MCAVASIAAAKSKLSPMSQQSIPRLELQAAVLGVRLADMIRSASSTPLVRITYWTDALNILWWINSSKRRYKPYVALRISEILSFTDVTNWRWVPGSLNPADIGTKPTDWDKNDRTTLWFDGPAFLKEDEEKWPKIPTLKPPDRPEVIKIMHIKVAREGGESCCQPYQSFDLDKTSKSHSVRTTIYHTYDAAHRGAAK